MEIIRDGHAYELTPAELEQAYRQQQQNYRLMDAARHLADHYGQTPDAPWDAEAVGSIQEDLDCTFASACDPNSVDYLLERIVERFEDGFDCNMDENQQYETAIQSIISSRQQMFTPDLSV